MPVCRPMMNDRSQPHAFVTANEFDDLKYFGSLEEAGSYAWGEFSGYIDALNERERDDDDGWEEIASADDDVTWKLLDWSGLKKIWTSITSRSSSVFKFWQNNPSTYPFRANSGAGIRLD